MNAPPDLDRDDGPDPPSEGSEEAPLRAGAYAGAYVIEGCIGEGVFGTVYRARHGVINAPAAVKVLKARYSHDPRMVNRFIDEARAASRASHPSIIDVFAFGRLPDGRRFIVMELLEGEGLDEVLARVGAFDVAGCVAVLGPIAAALAAAHAAGVTHRDVKPANIFVCRAGPPKLVDFGVAKLLDERASVEATADGLSIGTPAYMSPEQCLGEPATPASDVYALGVVTWRMLAGRLPFDAPAVVEVMNAHIAEAPPRLDRVQPKLTPAVARAVEAMLAKDPAARPDPVAAVEALAASAQARGTGRRWVAAAVLAAAAGAALAWGMSAEKDSKIQGVATSVSVAPVSAAPAAVVSRAAPATAAAPASVAAPATRPAAPASVSFTLADLPPEAQIRLGDAVLALDPDGGLRLAADRLPATVEISAPGYQPRTVALSADAPDVSGRLEPEPQPRPRAVEPRRADPHGIDPW